MKTFLPSTQSLTKLMMLVLVSFLFQQLTSAQSLTFKSPVKESGTDLAEGASYRFSNVTTNVDAIVKIEDLINGAEVREIDQSVSGSSSVGYNAAFQPLVYTPGGTGTSYALFSIKFVAHNGNSSVSLSDFAMTSLDIDGNATLKEFTEITMTGNNCNLNILSGPLQIAVSTLSGGYKGINLLGNEFDGIDTSAIAAMYTVKRSNVSSFNLKVGAVTIAASSAARQYSLYMKDFSYTLSTLPVKLSSFSANLNTNNKADIKWTTITETNASHFIVQRSTDGTNYSDAGMIFAYGSTTEKTNYSFSDNLNSVSARIIYYRLYSVDKDGKGDYSETRIIRLDKQADNNIAILTYPNPVSNEIRITVPAAWQNKKVVYEVFSANGQSAKRMETASSNQTEIVNVSNLNTGVYFVKVSCEGQTAQQKIVKQ